MSNLDLIRSLRRALAGLRDVTDPSAADHVARALANELETKLGQPLPSEPVLPREPQPAVTVLGVDGQVPHEIGMAVYA